MKWIRFFDPTLDELTYQLNSLRRLQDRKDKSAATCDHQLMEWLYRELDIVDAKLRQLLTFDGALVVLTGILFRIYTAEQSEPDPLLAVWSGVTLPFAVASALLSAQLGARWITDRPDAECKFFAQKTCSGDKESVRRLAVIYHLLAGTITRKNQFRLSKLFSIITMIMFSGFVLIDLSFKLWSILFGGDGRG